MNRALALRLLRDTAPSSAWWGPVHGHVSLATVLSDPQSHGLKDLVVSHPAETITFLPPEWCTPETTGAFCEQVPDPGPDLVASFDGCRFLGLDGLLITRSDHLLRDCLLQPGGDHNEHPAMRSPWYGPVRRIRGPVGIVTSRFSNNYYHWLFDILPRFEMLHRAGHDLNQFYLHCCGPFQRESLAMLGVEEDQILPAVARAQFMADEVFIPMVPGGLESVPLWVPRFLRNQFVPLPGGGPARLLYISRARGHSRKVANEDEVRAFLEKRGFETIFLEEMGFRQQVETLSAACAVVAAHGAGLANMAFCTPGTPIIECLRSDYINTLYFRLARICGHPYAAVVAPGDNPSFLGKDQRRVRASFAISVRELERAFKALDL